MENNSKFKTEFNVKVRFYLTVFDILTVKHNKWLHVLVAAAHKSEYRLSAVDKNSNLYTGAPQGILRFPLRRPLDPNGVIQVLFSINQTSSKPAARFNPLLGLRS